MKVALIYKIDKKVVESTLKESYTFKDFSEKLGYKSKSSDSYKVIKRYLKEHGLSYSHFVVPKRKKERYDKNDVLKFCFIEGSSYGSSRLSDYINKFNLKDNTCCYECGLEDNWNGKPLKLQLDHINGINTDNRLDNLRFLCPNCHSQTPTFAGRNVTH